MVAGFLVVVNQPVNVHAVFTYPKGSQKAGVRYGSRFLHVLLLCTI